MSLKKWSCAAWNFVALNPSRLVREILGKCFGVEFYRTVSRKVVVVWSQAWDGRHNIARFYVGGDKSLASKSSLWESNLFGESKIEADFWPGQSLVNNCFEGRPLCVPFKTARLHPGSSINRLCQQSFHVKVYVEKARVIERDWVIWCDFLKLLTDRFQACRGACDIRILCPSTKTLCECLVEVILS